MGQKTGLRLAFGGASIVVLVGLIVLVLQRPASPDRFYSMYWADPLAPQGAVPAGFSELEASLAPAACGQCHQEQYRHWRSSLHAQSMGPGIWWQLALLEQTEGNQCLRCHAPLAEQKALTAQAFGWANVPSTPRPSYVPADLHRGGLICAACHLRQHRRYGPPPRLETSSEHDIHQGFRTHDGFEDSRFCAVCHQFPADGPQVNGKLHEDTYNQWLASPASLRGEHCQHCHMPNRQHLWRGIHDKEMVREALRIDPYWGGDTAHGLRLLVTLTNLGAGHHLPTYMVAKLVIELQALAANNAIELIDRTVLGWYVETDLATERFDTRIPAGKQQVVEFVVPTDVWQTADAVELVVVVQPREHYERMFLDVLKQPGLSDGQRDAIGVALQEARATHYTLYRRSLSVP